MNWFFYFLIVIAVVLLWLLLSSLYKKVGFVFYKLGKKAKDEMADIEVVENDNLNEQNTDNTKTKETIE